LEPLFEDPVFLSSGLHISEGRPFDSNQRGRAHCECSSPRLILLRSSGASIHRSFGFLHKAPCHCTHLLSTGGCVWRG